MSAKKRLRPEDYTVGWLCALAQTEQVAAIKMLDEQHQELPKPARDYNTYTYGSIGSHNIVIACLPLSHPGTTSASRMADFLPTSFPNMRLHLFVGIGGGIPRSPPDPDANQDIHLGDVVVGVDQTPGVSGVVQYDFIRDQGEGSRELLGLFDKPNPELLTALGKLFSNYEMGDSNPQVHLAKLTGLRSDFSRPPPGGDKFYRSTYKHVVGAPNCDQCSMDELVVRNERQVPKQALLGQRLTEPETSMPVFHQGQILSGNSVVKDAERRDKLSREYPHARCIEMEAAGVVDQTHCLVIRGIGDYADSHKNQKWQPYAAGTAAAFARELLLTIQPSIVAELGNIASTEVQAADPPSEGQPVSGNMHWMVPKNANSLFTGRTKILEKLADSLGPQSQMSKQRKIFVIFGYGGIGKSEVCLKFANDYQEHFWGIFWIDASSEERAKQSFTDIGTLRGANAETFEQVKTWLANVHRSWLLIIDNADDPEIDYATFFPSGKEGNIILTTRNPQCREHATSECTEDLDHLDLQDATSLLFGAARIPESARKDNQEAAEKVVQALSSHTLAIVQAGAYIKQRRFSLEEYSTLFKQQEEQLLKYCPKQDQSTYGSVYKTFEISATHLESSPDQSAADALSLLQILGFFHFQEIPELMFSRARKVAIEIREHRGTPSPSRLRARLYRVFHYPRCRKRPLDKIYVPSELQISRLPLFVMQRNEIATDLLPPQWREALNLLESYSLIKTSGVDDSLSFSMHPLAHTWTRIRHGLEIQKEGWRAAGSIIALSMWGSHYDVFHEKLRSHVGAYLGHPVLNYVAEMTELEICQTQYQICHLVLNLRDTSKLRFLLQILEKFKAWTSASRESSLRIQTLTANCLIEEGKHRAAVELMERTVETDESHDLNRQVVLANAYIASQQYQKAVNLLEHIVEIRERTEAPEYEGLLWSKHELGRAYVENKQFEKAATLFEQVVEIKKKTLAPSHQSLLTSLYELGRAYLRIKKYEKAAEILQQVLEIRCRILDVKDPYLLGTKNALAVAYIGMGSGHRERAADLLEQVVGVREKTLAPENPELLASQHNLTWAYIGMGKDHYGRAAELLERVVRIEERTLAPENPELLASQHNLARTYIDMGKDHCERAAKLLEHVIEIREKTLAPDDLHLSALQHWLAEACIGMGNDHYGRAAEILEQVLRIDEKTLAPDDPRSLKTQQLFEEVNRLIQAEKDAESMTTSGEAV